MSSSAYSLDEILSMAKPHPFYVPTIEYPPETTPAKSISNRTSQQTHLTLKSQRLLSKPDLYNVIQRLVNDLNPNNTYRQGVYTSVTGGGLGGKPLFFATDVHENRRHRAAFGRFLAATSIIEPGDWVITTHCGGDLYRSLDLVLEIIENAGASVLSAGNFMAPLDVVRLMIDYRVNVLTGDSSQIVQIVYRISMLDSEERQRLNVDKIIYTSEILTAAQRVLIRDVLGAGIKICSILGSAEVGPWAVSSPDLTGHDVAMATADFVFDTRHTIIEIMPSSCVESEGEDPPAALPDGEKGIIVQTSLCRLRHPLVRYVTGDVGSLHDVPEHGRKLVSEEDWPHLKMLRLEGRDRRFSFDWDGVYFQFHNLTLLLNDAAFGLLQWQVIRHTLEPSKEIALEVRLLCAAGGTRETLCEKLRVFFHVNAANEHRFGIVFVENLDGFERSTTGRKVMKLVDRAK